VIQQQVKKMFFKSLLQKHDFLACVFHEIDNIYSVMNNNLRQSDATLCVNVCNKTPAMHAQSFDR